MVSLNCEVEVQKVLMTGPFKARKVLVEGLSLSKKIQLKLSSPLRGLYEYIPSKFIIYLNSPNFSV